MAHVIKTMENSLQSDSFSSLFKVPDVVAKLIEKGALGQKTKAGFYRKDGKAVMVLDPANGEYKPSTATVDPIVE